MSKSKPKSTRSNSSYSALPYPSRRNSWSQRVRLTPQWAAWRKSVFSRDGYQCIIPSCRAKKGLEPHHIVRKVDRPDLVYVVDNGVTLCHRCHELVTGREDLYIARFKGYITRLRARLAALNDMTGLI